ncbi:MAG TPA: PIN domain-containing protein [Xanthomonadaceae bacterium]|nr:PIN domain-containing protein [Xanthomonadaceae bacterium]
MTVLYFVDTNLLIYARDPQRNPVKHQRARQWLEQLWRDRSGRLSTQVLNEYYAVVTQKLTPALSPDEAQIEIRTFFAWRPRVLDTATIEQAWQVQGRYRFNWWDALIVAAAQLSGCSQLLTEDLQAGQNLDGLVVVNPFGS